MELNKLTDKDSLNEVQKYIEQVIKERGFGNQPVQDAMLLLLEEAGELAKAIRKADPDLTIDHNKIQNYTSVESEVADVFIVLVSICNLLDINLFEALSEKEKENVNRTWK